MPSDKLDVSTAPTALTAQETLWAIGIAVAASFLLALIEVPNKSRTSLYSCLVAQAAFYWLVLSFGNVVTTLLASLSVTKLPAGLAPYYFLLSAFLGYSHSRLS